MKKKLLFLTLFLTMFAFIARAQITIFNEGFEDGVLPAGWTSIDADNDGNTWVHNSTTYVDGHTGEGAYVSFSKLNGAALTPDNWLVTPAITLTGASTLHFWRMSGFSQPQEHYGILVSTISATDLTSFSEVFEETPTAYNWAEKTVDLSAYAGQTIYIAFRHYNCTNKLALILDDVSVTTISASSIITAVPTALQFPNVPVGVPTAAQVVSVSSYNVTGVITATVDAPFEISTNNINYSGNVTLSNTDSVLYVRYYPSTTGTDSAVLTLTDGSVSTEVFLSGSSIDCDITIPYEQNFNSVPENGLPACWTKINPFDGYPKATADYGTGSGDKVLMFKCNYNTYEPIYAVMPMMPEDLSNLQISFSTFREGSWSGTLSVGYVTSPGDSSSFVPVWSINAAQIGDNNPHPYLVSFGNIGTDPNTQYYITFKYETSMNWYWFVDDIIVEELAPCAIPTDLAVGNVTSTTATISWNGNANSYFLYYKTSYDTAWTEIQYVAPETDGYTLTELLPATTYSWYVASVCDDGSTVNSLETSTFTTECSTFSTPFVQNFDASTIPQCWGRYNGLADNIFNGGTFAPTTSGWVFNSSLVFGSNHPKVNVYGTSCNYWLVSPAINLGTLTNPVLTFDLALTKWNNSSPITDINGQPDDKFMVIVSTDLGATWTASNATVWSNDSTGDYVFNQIPAAGQEVTLSLSEYEGQTVMIAFYAESTVSNGDNDLHIDNVVVTNATSCTKPTNLSVAAVTSNSVTLAWSESGTATAWNIEYGPTGYQQGSSLATVVEANTNPFTISDLSAGTYDFYVQADCGADQSLWLGPITVTPGQFNMGISGSDTLTSCSLTIYDNGGPNGNYSASCDYILVLFPETEGDAVAVSGTYTTENNWDFLRIYDGMDTSGTMLGEFSGTGTVPLLVSSSGPLTLWFTSDAGMQYSGFVLTTSCSTCMPPGNLTVSNVTDNSADLTWTGTASSYKVEYKTLGATEWDTIITADTFYLLTSLEATTTYMVNVYADCGSQFSPAVSTTFSTAMATTAIPYSTDFSAGSDQSWLLNNGSCASSWMIGSVNDSTSALFVTSNGNTPGYNANSFSVISAEKLFTVGDAAELTISFDVQSGGEANFDYLKVFFAPADVNYPAATTNTTYANENYSQNAINFSEYLQYSSYSSYPYKFNLTDGNTVSVSVVVPNPNATPNTTSTAKLVFLWKNDSNVGTQPGAIIYNVSVEALSCMPPTQLTIDNITPTDAELSWTPGDEETDWNLEYREASTSTWTPVTVTGLPSYQFSNLTAGTTYYVRVQADCGDNQSLWATTSFFTPCYAISTFPHNEGFENGGNMPDCWSQEYVTGSVSWDFQAGADSHGGIHDAHSGDYNAFLFIESSNNNTTRLVSPVFDLTVLTSPYITFWHAQQPWGNDQDRLSVFYRTSATDEWQLLTQYLSAVSAWTMDSLALPNPSATYQIAFSGIINYGYGIVVDDITVGDAGGSGPVITDPTVATNAATAIAQTTATLNATITNPDNVSITAKGFEWKTTAGGTYTQVTGTGTGNTFTANLTDLAPNTGYTYKAFITYNGTTVYGSEMTFTTLPEGIEPCNVPTGLHTTNIENHAITIAWDANANVSSWNIHYRPQNGTWSTESSNTNSYTLTGLEGLTTYEIQVQANCGNGNLSDWSAAITATTTNVGIENHLANSITLYPNPAKEVVNVQCTMYNVQGVEVFDVFGKSINTVIVMENPTRINVSGLANGMYFVRVTTNEGTVTKTFIKK